MYTFSIIDNGPDLDVMVTRAMLALAALASMVFHGDEHYYLNLLSAFVLLLTTVFMKLLLEKFRINKFVLLSVAACVLFIATHSVTFALILLLYGYLVKFLNQKPVIAITNEGITIKKLFTRQSSQWNELSNIVLKDGLLTLDFRNNRLIQVRIDENTKVIDENAFNDFCKGLI